MTQGGTTSPVIFNVVGDAIVREHAHRFPTVKCAFYADDGQIASKDPQVLQPAVDYMAELFLRVGMRTNTDKTKAMIGHNGTLRLQLSMPAYKRLMSGKGLPYKETKHQKVTCPHCDKELQQASLGRHVHAHQNDLQRPAKRKKLLEEATWPSRQFQVFSPTYCTPLECPIDD